MEESAKSTARNDAKNSNRHNQEDIAEAIKAIGQSLGTQGQWSEVMENVAKVAERGNSRLINLLVGVGIVTLGAVILLLTLFWKLQIFGVDVSNLGPPEFVAALFVGTLLVIIGGALQTYSYKGQLDQHRLVIESSEGLIRDAIHLQGQIIEYVVRPPGESTTQDLRPQQQSRVTQA